jgi:hypothetical protein
MLPHPAAITEGGSVFWSTGRDSAGIERGREGARPAAVEIRGLRMEVHHGGMALQRWSGMALLSDACKIHA